MRNLNIFYLIVFLFLGCKASNSSVSLPNMGENINQKWELFEIRGEKVKTVENIPFVLFEGSQVSGNAGCNAFSGVVEMKSNNGLKFSKIVSTMKGCSDMVLENELHKVLRTTDSYNIKDNVLSLARGKMAPLAKFKKVED